MTTLEWITSMTSVAGFAFLAWNVLMLRGQLRAMEEQNRHLTRALEESVT